MTQPKVEQPKPVVEEPKFTAPIETPKEIPQARAGDRSRLRVPVSPAARSAASRAA